MLINKLFSDQLLSRPCYPNKEFRYEVNTMISAIEHFQFYSHFQFHSSKMNAIDKYSLSGFTLHPCPPDATKFIATHFINDSGTVIEDVFEEH